MTTTSPHPTSPDGGGTGYPTPYEVAREEKAKMIRKMLWLGYEMHFDKPRSAAEQMMDRKRLCLNHVEAWCKSSKCCINKTLKGYKLEELRKVLRQFEQVHRSFLEEYKKAG